MNSSQHVGLILSLIALQQCIAMVAHSWLSHEKEFVAFVVPSNLCSGWPVLVSSALGSHVLLVEPLSESL